MAEQVFRAKTVREKFHPVSKSKFFDDIRKQLFPAPDVAISPYLNGWSQGLIERYQQEQKARAAANATGAKPKRTRRTAAQPEAAQSIDT